MTISILYFNVILVHILVRPALLAGREKGEQMSKLVFCEFLIIYTPGIEDSFETTIAMRAEMDWLIYNDPLSYAKMVLDGSLESYLRRVSGKHSLELDD